MITVRQLLGTVTGRTKFLIAATCAVGCSAAPDDFQEIGDESPDPEIAALQQEILNGHPLTETTNAITFGDAFGGFVALGHSPSGTEKVFCSGTLLSNTVLITAKHCLQHSSTNYLVNSPSLLKVTMGRNSFLQTRQGLSIHFHSAHDLAMVVVSSGFFMVNSQESLTSTGYSRQIFTGGGASVDGSFLACFGHGRNVENCAPNDPNNCTGSGVGQLRMALLQANYETFSGTPPFYRFYPNDEDQLMARGDSGGSCVEPIVTYFGGRPDKAQIISVHSSAFPASFANDTPIELSFDPSWSKVSP